MPRVRRLTLTVPAAWIAFAKAQGISVDALVREAVGIVIARGSVR